VNVAKSTFLISMTLMTYCFLANLVAPNVEISQHGNFMVITYFLLDISILLFFLWLFLW